MTDTPSPHTVALPAALDQSATSDLLAELAQHRGETVTLNAAEVDHVSANFAQMLLSARKTWIDEDAAIHIETPSDAFRTSIALLGLEHDLLGDRQ